MRAHHPAIADDPPVTVLVCTRNRGATLVPTVRSVLACSYPRFSLLIVDQSDDDATAEALAPFGADPRLHYLHSASAGLSVALNIGLAASETDIVAITDDDCEVPAGWIAEMVAPFQRHARVGLVFCDVVAAPYDPERGFIPVSIGRSPLLIPELARWTTNDGVNIGIGAGMAVRRSAAAAIGGFNPLFGVGSRFQSGNDLEFCLHALAAGHQIYRTTDAAVVHYGFRTHEQLRQLIRRNMFGAGAAYGELLRRGHWIGLRCCLVTLIRLVIEPALRYIARGQAPRVLGRALWLLRGFSCGLTTPPLPRDAGFLGVPELEGYAGRSGG